MCLYFTLISACVMRRLVGLCFTVAALESTSGGRCLITTTGSLVELSISSNFSVRNTHKRTLKKNSRHPFNNKHFTKLYSQNTHLHTNMLCYCCKPYTVCNTKSGKQGHTNEMFNEIKHCILYT